MDRKEAADLLDNLIGMVEDSHGADYDTALRMGIEALSANGDIIYRQAEIDALNRIGSLDTDADMEYAKGIFERLPSAQPEIKNPCSECQEFECYGCEFKKDFHGGSNEY